MTIFRRVLVILTFLIFVACDTNKTFFEIKDWIVFKDSSLSDYKLKINDTTQLHNILRQQLIPQFKQSIFYHDKIKKENDSLYQTIFNVSTLQFGDEYFKHTYMSNYVLSETILKEIYSHINLLYEIQHLHISSKYRRFDSKSKLSDNFLADSLLKVIQMNQLSDLKPLIDDFGVHGIDSANYKLYVKWGFLPLSMEKELFRVNSPGLLAKVLHSEHGYHILYINNIQNLTDKIFSSFDQLKDSLIAETKYIESVKSIYSSYLIENVKKDLTVEYYPDNIRNVLLDLNDKRAVDLDTLAYQNRIVASVFKKSILMKNISFSDIHLYHYNYFFSQLEKIQEKPSLIKNLIDIYVTSIAKNILLESDEKYLFDETKVKLQVGLVALKLYKKKIDEIHVSDDDIYNYYDENKQNLMTKKLRDVVGFSVDYNKKDSLLKDAPKITVSNLNKYFLKYNPIITNTSKMKNPRIGIISEDALGEFSTRIFSEKLNVIVPPTNFNNRFYIGYALSEESPRLLSIEESAQLIREQLILKKRNELYKMISNDIDNYFKDKISIYF